MPPDLRTVTLNQADVISRAAQATSRIGLMDFDRIVNYRGMCSATDVSVLFGKMHDDLTGLFRCTMSEHAEAIWNPKQQLPASLSERVAAIKSAFGLTVTQTAQVLQVKRPTVYVWLDPDSAPDYLRNANRDRLLTLSRVAEVWNRMSGMPLQKEALTKRIGDSTLLDRLTADTLNIASIGSTLRALRDAGAFYDSRVSLGERLRKNGFADVPSKRGQT